MKDSLMSIVISRLRLIPTPSLLLLIAVFTAIPITIPPGSVIAEEPKEGAIEEMLLLKEETVSIAVRHEQPISEAPSNVYVITDEDIRQSGAIDLPTVLRRIPGMEVMQTTGAEFNLSVRGDNQLLANKLLVLVDGRSIYLDFQGNVYWKLIPVTLPEIKRIEVLKGPASAVYGFNAFDGVINIITKSPEEMKGTTLQFGGGEFGTISSAAIHAGTIGKFGYRLSVGEDQNLQWRNRDALAFRAHKFNVQTEYALSGDSKLSVSGGLVDTIRFDGPVTATSFIQDNPTLGYAYATYERRNFVFRSWWYGFYDDNVNTRNPLLAPFQRFEDRTLMSNSQQKFRGNTYNVEAQHSLELAPGNRFTYGVNYRHNTASSNLFTEFSREDRLGFYIQDEWKATGSLSLVAGTRYDLDTFINPTISPRIALIYNPIPDHTFRVSGSVAYRPPTLFETKLDARTVITLPPPSVSPPPIVAKGNENLGPEQIISYEATYQGWFLKHRLRVRADLFFNHISDLLGVNHLGQSANVGEGDIYGGEAAVEFLATRWLSGFANYAYQEVGQNFTGLATRSAPRFKWNMGLRGEWENGLSGEVSYHYYGATTYPISAAFTQFAPLGGFTPPNPRVGSYNLLNLRGAYRFWQQQAAAGYTREAEVAVSVFNALNDMHKEHPLGDTIGSRVMGWLTLKF